MKYLLLALALCTSLITFAGETPPDTNDDSKAFWLKAGSMVVVAGVGGYAAHRFPYHRGKIGAATVAALASAAYFNIYTTLYAVGTTYCFSAAYYLGTPCPCCPPGCFMLPGC